jgi:hypothetical protein
MKKTHKEYHQKKRALLIELNKVVYDSPAFSQLRQELKKMEQTDYR